MHFNPCTGTKTNMLQAGPDFDIWVGYYCKRDVNQQTLMDEVNETNYKIAGGTSDV